MARFQSAKYSPQLAGLLDEAWLNELGPGQPQEQRTPQVMALDHDAFGRAVVAADMADCCLAAMRLRFDLLEPSHQLSQQIHTASGSYWHGIMHRREGDFGNAKYWFRSAGDHPGLEPMSDVLGQLSAAAAQPPDWLVALTPWEPFAFVDVCQAASKGQLRQPELARQVALLEWQCLFDWCYRQAIGEDNYSESL